VTHIFILLSRLFLARITYSFVSVKHVGWRIALGSCDRESYNLGLLANNWRLLSYFDIDILLKNLYVPPLLILGWRL
jgi:hypothetical protein